MSRKLMVTVLLALALLAVMAVPAFASDHLFNATNSPGADVRGFTNPVAANPSGMSAAMARPATVPGEGNPNAGQHMVTPAVDLSLVRRAFRWARDADGSLRVGGDGVKLPHVIGIDHRPTESRPVAFLD